MSQDHLDLSALRATLRHLAAGLGLRYEESGGSEGFQAVLSPEEDAEEVFFAVGAPGGGYLSLSLLLVVEESFLRENFSRVLDVLSEFDVCASRVRDERLAEGEVYLGLALRIFQDGLGVEVLRLALENLREAREALAGEFL